MKERPILFSGEMVRAILDGRKTQTRRAIKQQPDVPVSDAIPRREYPHGPATTDWYWRPKFGHRQSAPSAGWDFKCPYGQPGDRLYVKETHWAWGRWETRFDAKKGRDAWRFIDMTLECGKSYQFEQPVPMGTRSGLSPAWHKRPSLFMPRHASRILLEIIDVRIERIMDISEADAMVEGVTFTDFGKFTPKGAASLDGGKTHHPFKPKQHSGYHVGDVSGPDECHATARGAFAALWISINGTDAWADNPMAWVVEFQRIGVEEKAA